MFKNVASQRWIVFAYDTTDGSAKTGDAANITAKIAKNGAAAGATNDTNPTELEDGYYAFDLTQAETNANELWLTPESATSNINVIGCPPVIYTRPQYFGDITISAAGHVEANTVEIEGSDPTDQINAACDTALSDYDAVVPADLPSNFGDLAITVTTGKVTVGTNDDKTGYTASTVSDKTGYSLAADQSGVTVGTVNALGAQAKLDVNAEADTALSDYDPPTRAELTTDKNSIITQVDANETKIDTIDTNVDTLITRVPAEVAQKAHLVDGTGDITPPTNKGIWDSLGDGSKGISDLNDISVANIFANVVENSKSLTTILRLIYAFCCNETQGGGSNTIIFRDDADTKARLTMTVDADNDRTAVVKDGS